MNIPQTLKDARQLAGVTQAEADQICDLGRGQFAAWESGRNVPLVVTIEGVLLRLRHDAERRQRRLQKNRKTKQ
jgi:transcriptional regulator with XRE-family HTH domain